MSDLDAIIIGGGHNGLVAAAYLARAGRKTRRGVKAAAAKSATGKTAKAGGSAAGRTRGLK